MTLDQLFKRFRSDTDDTKTPYLWSVDDLESYFNWALEELAKKALYFYDTSTWVALDVTADSAKVAATSDNFLDRILSIRRATLGSDGRKLAIRTMYQAHEEVGGDDYGRIFTNPSSWETSTGTPRVLLSNFYDDGSLRLGPTPTDADVLSLWAYRLPLRYIAYDQCKDTRLFNLAGIREYSHELTLVQGMKSRAYLKEDPETRDTQLASEANGAFYSDVAVIKRQLERKRHPPGVVRYGGI